MLRWRAICRGNPGRARHCGKRKRAAPDANNSPFSSSRIRFSFLPSSPPTNAHFEKMLLLLRWMCPEADMGAGKGRTSSSCTFSDIAPPPEMQPRKEEEEGGGEAPRKQISCFSSSFYPACSLYRNPPPRLFPPPAPPDYRKGGWLGLLLLLLRFPSSCDDAKAICRQRRRKKRMELIPIRNPLAPIRLASLHLNSSLLCVPFWTADKVMGYMYLADICLRNNIQLYQRRVNRKSILPSSLPQTARIYIHCSFLPPPLSPGTVAPPTLPSIAGPNPKPHPILFPPCSPTNIFRKPFSSVAAENAALASSEKSPPHMAGCVLCMHIQVWSGNLDCVTPKCSMSRKSMEIANKGETSVSVDSNLIKVIGRTWL